MGREIEPRLGTHRVVVFILKRFFTPGLSLFPEFRRVVHAGAGAGGLRRGRGVLG
jgi:hypothetical protein